MVDLCNLEQELMQIFVLLPLPLPNVAMAERGTLLYIVPDGGGGGGLF